MGMATITFTVHNDEQGRLIGDVYVLSRNQNSGLLTNFYQAWRCFTQPWHCWPRFYRPKWRSLLCPTRSEQIWSEITRSDQIWSEFLASI